MVSEQVHQCPIEPRRVVIKDGSYWIEPHDRAYLSLALLGGENECTCHKARQKLIDEARRRAAWDWRQKIEPRKSSIGRVDPLSTGFRARVTARIQALFDERTQCLLRAGSIGVRWPGGTDGDWRQVRVRKPAPKPREPNASPNTFNEVVLDIPCSWLHRVGRWPKMGQPISERLGLHRTPLEPQRGHRQFVILDMQQPKKLAEPRRGLASATVFASRAIAIGKPRHSAGQPAGDVKVYEGEISLRLLATCKIGWALGWGWRMWEFEPMRELIPDPETGVILASA